MLLDKTAGLPLWVAAADGKCSGERKTGRVEHGEP